MQIIESVKYRFNVAKWNAVSYNWCKNIVYNDRSLGFVIR